jgi:hypothetical protein
MNVHTLRSPRLLALTLVNGGPVADCRERDGEREPVFCDLSIARRSPSAMQREPPFAVGRRTHVGGHQPALTAGSFAAGQLHRRHPGTAGAGDRDGPALPGAGPSAAAQDTAGAKAAAASIGLSCSRTMPPVADTACLCSGVRADFEPRSRPRRRWHRSDGTGCFAFGTVDRATGAAPSSKRRRLRPHPWRVPAAAVQPSQRGVHLAYLHLGNPCQRKETGAAHALCPGCVAIRRVDWFTPRGMIRRWLR